MRVREEIVALRAETGEILDRLKGRRPCRHGVCHPEADCTCQVVPVDYTTMESAARVMPAAAMLALRSLLRVVPGDYFRIRPSKGDVTVACVCRRGFRMRPGFADCRCGRTFAFTGRRLLVMRPE